MALLTLLLACMAPEESYRTTGTIIVLEADCDSGGVTFYSEHSAVHLLGIEVCDVGCSPTEYKRAAGALAVKCGPDATARARFLQLDTGI
jgi:hypothetical protein